MSLGLVIIDMQRALVAGAYREADVVSAIRKFTDRAREAGVPICYVQHNHATFELMKRGTPGWEIHQDLAPLGGDLVIEKTACDAFFATDLALKLREQGIEEILLAGMQTDYCVDTSARSALNHGFNVVLLSDCHTTGDGHLPAADIVAHHNQVLPNVVHPNASIKATPSEAFEI